MYIIKRIKIHDTRNSQILIVIVKYLNFCFYCMIKVDIKGPLLRLTTWVKIFNLFDFHKDSNVVSSKAWYPSYFINHFLKELSLSHKLKFTNSNIFATWIVLTFAIFNFIWSYRLYSLKHLRLTPLGCKNIGIRKSEFGAKHAPLNRRGR